MPGGDNRQFVVIAGKGGVGRTTVSLALGISAARAGRRTLVCLADAPARYSELIGGVSLGPQPRRVSSGLDVVNLEPVASREEYGLKVLRNKTLHRILFGSKVVNAFLDAVPGLAEWAIFGKATFHALEEEVGGGYHLVIFDSPATGHGLDVLALPSAIAQSVPAGRIGEEAAQRVELLEDPARSEIIPVAIPEETPVNEALELIAALRERGMAPRRVIVNMVSELDVPGAVEEMVDEASVAGGLPRWLNPAAIDISRRDIQRESLERLRHGSRLPLVELPLLGPGGLDEVSLLKIAAALDLG